MNLSINWLLLITPGTGKWQNNLTVFDGLVSSNNCEKQNGGTMVQGWDTGAAVELLHYRARDPTSILTMGAVYMFSL